MKCFIKCGEIDSHILYIILLITLKILNDFIKGFNYNETFDEIHPIKSDNIHYFINITFQYLGTGFLGLIILIYQKCTFKPKNQEKTKEDKRETNNQLNLIHKNPEEEIRPYELGGIVVLLHFTWIAEEQLFKIFQFILKDLDFWMFEILTISLITSIIFKKKIFKHQWLAISLNLFSTLLKSGTIILSIFDNENYQPGGLPILYIKRPFFLFGLIFYFAFILQRSTVNLGLKWFMDVKSIASNKFLMIHGFLGAFICFIICLTSTFFKCSTLYTNHDPNEAYLARYICFYSESNGKTTDYYFENFKSYNLYSNEGIILIFGIIVNSLYKLFYISIIKFFTPIHVIFYFPLYYFIQKMILMINNFCKEKTFFLDNINKYKKWKFFLDISGDCISIFGFLIFLELIVFECNQYDYNIKENIIKRAAYEMSDNISEADTSFYNEDNN